MAFRILTINFQFSSWQRSLGSIKFSTVQLSLGPGRREPSRHQVPFCFPFVFVRLRPSSQDCLAHIFHVCLQMHDIVKAVGNCSYNQLVEKIISCKQSDNSELAGEGERPRRVSLSSSEISALPSGSLRRHPTSAVAMGKSPSCCTSENKPGHPSGASSYDLLQGSSVYSASCKQLVLLKCLLIQQ